MEFERKTPLSRIFFGFRVRRLGALLCLSSLSGCVMSRPQSEFLTMKTAMTPGQYFAQEYVVPNKDLSPYHKVQVKLVGLKYLDPEINYNWQEIRTLRDHFQGILETKLTEGYLLLDREADTDAETIVIEPMLVFLSPAQRYVKVDGRRHGTAGIPMATGMAAFEAKILDGRTGHLLAEVSEQQNDGGNLKAVTYDAFKRYANTEAVFRKWSDQMLRMLRSLTGDRPFHEDFGSDMSGLLIQDVQAIQEIHKTWREKELAGKSQELLDLCADDVTWIPPQAAPILGKAQVAEHLRETTPEVSSIMVTDRAIRGGGSVAYLTSHYSKVFRPPGAVLSQTVMGENLWVLRKFPGQGWKVVVVSWNQVPVELA